MLVWGCRPGNGILVNTKMIPELTKRMIERYSRETMQLILPSAFEDLAGSDVDFEIVSSQTL